MARTWPFEGKAEPEEPFHHPGDFVRRRGPGVEAVVVRIGLHDAQLVLVDQQGRWERWVYTSTEEAQRAAEDVGLTPHSGAYPDELRVRMNAFVRPREDFESAAYREQGKVGPVIPYPENRPRRVQPPPAPTEEEEPEEFRRKHPGLFS